MFRPKILDLIASTQSERDEVVNGVRVLAVRRYTVKGVDVSLGLGVNIAGTVGNLLGVAVVVKVIIGFVAK